MSTAPLYALHVSEVYRALEARPDGLAPEEAQARLATYGPNAISAPPGTPFYRKLIEHSTHTMALLLWVAGAIAIFDGHANLGIVIWIVVVVNAGFSFWQEHRAEQAVAMLEQLLPAHAHVIRSGEEAEIVAAEVVPGDVLVLAEGDNIPADARVVEEYGLRANHATLTGESVPARKTAEASLREGLTELERPNLVFAGTSVVSGTGRAVVFATGMLTQFGRIANLTQAVKDEPSRIQHDMARVTQIFSMLAITLGVIVFFVGSTDVGLPVTEAFIFAIGIIVATVPEGLLPTVTLALAIGVQRLARRGVLVKKLAVVETLANTSVICSDKSGTLTQNQMMVSEVWVGGERLSVSGVGYEPKGEFTPTPSGDLAGDLGELLTAATLCNNSRLNPPTADHPHWTCLGDQTEAALRVAALKRGIEEQAASQAFPRVHELPFDARRKRMSTIHQVCDAATAWFDPEEHDKLQLAAAQVAFVKGAPREVLQLCTHILMGGRVILLDEPTRSKIMAANDDYARNALRVLALACRELPPYTLNGGATYTHEKIEHELTFLGLLAMMDPPRPQVAEAIKTCREAGIRMVMVTGDYGLTAESVARRVGMLSTQYPRILIGADVDVMDEAALQAALDEETIFARMAPEHKLKLVAAFQARGEVVAVTGDGVNDAPALRKADIGIVMGVTGTDVAKEAADVILTGDDFRNIAAAIEEGRAVYDNIRKFVTYIVASNVPEVIPFIVTALFHVPLALTVAQVLAIDLGTDLFPALALGMESPEPNVMKRPPRKRDQSLLDTRLLMRALWLGLVEAALCYAGFFFVYYSAGYTDFFNLPRYDWWPLSRRLTLGAGVVYVMATTVFHAGVVMAQIGNVFACRTETEQVRRMGLLTNRFLIAGIAIEALIILSIIYVPPLAWVFEHRPIPFQWWGWLVLFGPILYLLEWVRKNIARLAEKRREHKILAPSHQNLTSS